LALVISEKEYEDLKARLRRYSDIEKVSLESSIDEETLLVIYTQKITRDATRRYYRVKSQSRKFHHQWRSGKPLIKFSLENRFPPVLTSFIILLEGNITRKGFWRMVQNPGSIGDARLRREIKEVLKADPIYSPAGADVQAARGRMGEDRLQEWLQSHDIPYQDEEDLRGNYPKTPDILLDDPIEWNGSKLFWIESKANFGDRTEVGRNFKKQLKPYSELFGPGMVIYWFGVIDRVQGRREDVFVATSTILDDIHDCLDRT
jgi:hypothetical protein